MMAAKDNVNEVWDFFAGRKGAMALSEGLAANEEDDRQRGLLWVAAE